MAKGQALIEYSLIFAVLVISVIFMSVFVRRAIVGRVKEETEKIGSRYEYGGKMISRATANYSHNITINTSYFTGRINAVDYYIESKTINTHKDDISRDINETILY